MAGTEFTEAIKEYISLTLLLVVFLLLIAANVCCIYDICNSMVHHIKKHNRRRDLWLQSPDHHTHSHSHSELEIRIDSPDS